MKRSKNYPGVELSVPLRLGLKTPLRTRIADWPFLLLAALSKIGSWNRLLEPIETSMCSIASFL